MVPLFRSHPIIAVQHYTTSPLGINSARCFHSISPNFQENIWKLTQSSQEQYWKGYLSTRPKYPNAFYDRIYKYHATNSNRPSFSVAHDVGAGPGQVSEKLASKFKHVVVSDNIANHVEYAQQTLRENLGEENASSKFSYIVSRGEELHAKCPPESTDLIASALTLPLMDSSEALHSFHTLLKPNGTLAIWFYGRAHFAEPEYAKKCQPLLDRIIDHHFAGVIQQQLGPEYTASWKKVADGIASWLDYVQLASEQWRAVQRVKWNRSWAEMGFFSQQACDFNIDSLTSNVRDGEEVIEIEDADLWKKEWNLPELRTFVDYIFPFTQMNEHPVEIIWSELEWEMGGSDERRAFSWPAVLILAAKK